MLLYMDDSYLREFTAKVTMVHDVVGVTLSETAFYPRGGGQPCDTGKLFCRDKEYVVISVNKVDGVIIHELSEQGLQVGDEVTGIIDWDKRYNYMRAHTASHVISAVFHDEFHAKITGNQLSEDKIRIDFDLENFDRELLQGAIDKANAYLAEDLLVTSTYMKREDALKDPSLVKLAGALPPAVDELRIVAIGAVDKQADGGTHVKSTKEVGSLVLLKAENKGKNNRRVYVSLVK